MAPVEASDVSLAAALWRANADLAAAAAAHPFVRRLGDGTLAREQFQRYVAQDAYFLESFARAYALGLARCPDREGIWAFFELLAGVQDELRLHAGYAARWGVVPAATAPSEATLNYTDFLLATAATAGVGELCAAMAPCMRLYAHLGQALAPSGDRDDNPYAEWVRTYADPAFEALALRLEGLLDRYALDGPTVRAAYRRAMALELAFFEAAARG
jgi:thiaminase/transcriptional activator TenA